MFLRRIRGIGTVKNGTTKKGETEMRYEMVDETGEVIGHFDWERSESLDDKEIVLTESGARLVNKKPGHKLILKRKYTK